MRVVTSGVDTAISTTVSETGGTGIARQTDVPEGMTTVSQGVGGGTTSNGAGAGQEGEGWAAMASCSRDRTSSALARSIGDCPSWFLRKESAPCASWLRNNKNLYSP